MQNLKDVYDIEACFEAPPWGPRGLHVGTNLQAQHLLYQITHWGLRHNKQGQDMHAPSSSRTPSLHHGLTSVFLHTVSCQHLSHLCPTCPMCCSHPTLSSSPPPHGKLSATAFCPAALRSAAVSRLTPGAAAALTEASGLFPGSTIPRVHCRQLSLPRLL